MITLFNRRSNFRGRYLSGSDPLQVFAASDGFMGAEIQWRDGTIP
ncbi:MAG: hypothetical protein CM1200mP1_13740 [Candidatus Neomarinimicrobiota bacterium]|nr:MAG: hypothetical protein CM1200mP1_13740 [Candidatus Neomarinimicrobiota bacterium]